MREGGTIAGIGYSSLDEGEQLVGSGAELRVHEITRSGWAPIGGILESGDLTRNITSRTTSIWTSTWTPGAQITKPISTLRSLMDDGSYGVLPSSDDYGHGDLRFLRAQDVGEFLIEANGEVLVPRHYANPKAMSHEGDLLLKVKGRNSWRCHLPEGF